MNNELSTYEILENKNLLDDLLNDLNSGLDSVAIFRNKTQATWTGSGEITTNNTLKCIGILQGIHADNETFWDEYALELELDRLDAEAEIEF